MKTASPSEKFAQLAHEFRDEWPEARVEVEQFPSGAASLDVWRDGRFYVLRYTPTYHAYDVTEMTEKHVLDSGPCDVFDDLDTAATRLREIIAVPVPRS